MSVILKSLITCTARAALGFGVKLGGEGSSNLQGLRAGVAEGQNLDPGRRRKRVIVPLHPGIGEHAVSRCSNYVVPADLGLLRPLGARGPAGWC